MKETNWYVLFVMGGKEKAICEHLVRMEDLNAFTPLMEVVHKKEGSYQTVQKPMFPSYIFIESELDTATFQNKVKLVKSRKTGIVKELRYDDGITALSTQEKNYIEALLNKNYVVEKSTGCIVNDQVIITEGPLIGHESSIVKIDRHKQKATLRVHLFQKGIEVKVALEIVKKI